MDRRTFFKVVTTGVVIVHIPFKHPPIEGANYFVSLHTTDRIFDTQQVPEILGPITFRESDTTWGVCDQFTVTTPSGDVYMGKLNPSLFLGRGVTPKVSFTLFED